MNLKGTPVHAGMIGAHWPERLYRAFIINMPGFFSVLWKLVEPMMAASTRRKIRLLRGKEVSPNTHGCCPLLPSLYPLLFDCMGIGRLARCLGVMAPQTCGGIKLLSS